MAIEEVTQIQLKLKELHKEVEKMPVTPSEKAHYKAGYIQALNHVQSFIGNNIQAG